MSQLKIVQIVFPICFRIDKQVRFYLKSSCMYEKAYICGLNVIQNDNGMVILWCLQLVQARFSRKSWWWVLLTNDVLWKKLVETSTYRNQECDLSSMIGRGGTFFLLKKWLPGWRKLLRCEVFRFYFLHLWWMFDQIIFLTSRPWRDRDLK